MREMSENLNKSRSGSTSSSANIDEPPMSRLFVVCDKSINEEMLREAFQQYGTIQYIWVIKDKQTQQNKGFAYVKFEKTSEAAIAQESLDDVVIGQSQRPLKVLVAANPKQENTKSENDNEKYLRLFVTLPKTATENEISSDFSKYGVVEKVTIVKDRNTNEVKGFGYVKFAKFSHAAMAYESCPSKYNAVFAEPKPLKRNFQIPHQENRSTNEPSRSRDSTNDANSFAKAFSNLSHESCPTALEVHCSNSLTQDQIWRLFDVIPGLDYCKVGESGSVSSVVSVLYKNPEAAAYAQEKFHGFEYPIGERLIVKIVSSGSSNVETVIREDICSVQLPPVMEPAPLGAPVAIRLFIILSANIPQPSLKNIFSRFPGLIEAYLLTNKNCGYVKYAQIESGKKAMALLNGAEIYGCQLKVVEADEPPREIGNDVKRSRRH